MTTPLGTKVYTGFYPEFCDAEEYISEKAKLHEWFYGIINGSGAPFSFSYGGSAFDVSSLEKTVTESKDADGNDTLTVLYTDTKTKLTIALGATLFYDSPTVEFVLHLKNAGNADTPVISAFNSMDISYALQSERGGTYTLDTARGCCDDKVYYDHKIVTARLESGESETFAPHGGRSSDSAWPFFDILGTDCGLIIAVGWTGQWTATFTNENEKIHMQAGLENFSSYLKPGEEIRTPSYSITYFDGKPEYGHNIFRRLVLKEYTPDNGTGEKYMMPIDLNEWGGRTTEEITSDIKAYSEAGIPADTVWMDAAWFLEDKYVQNGDPNGWVYSVGSWQTNTQIHPSGSLKEISDCAHDAGMRFMLWVEFERAWKTSVFAETERDRFYPLEKAGSLLLKLSEEETYDFAFDYICGLIEKHGIDTYRQDFNMSPLECWLDYDEENRVGITETNYITNLYRLYDTLLEKYPGLMIDTFASGGRRIDFEMMKRAQPFLRSDYICFGEPDCTSEGIQLQAQSISYWLPLSGTTFPQGIDSFTTDYTFRSSAAPCVSLPWDQTGAGRGDKEKLKKYVTELVAARPLFYGDYYQLIPTAYDTTSWQGYQLMRPDTQCSLVAVYSRPESTRRSRTLKLKGFIENESYRLQYADFLGTDDNITVYTGKQLMEEGITVELNAEDAELIFISIITE